MTKKELEEQNDDLRGQLAAVLHRLEYILLDRRVAIEYRVWPKGDSCGYACIETTLGGIQATVEEICAEGQVINDIILL